MKRLMVDPTIHMTPTIIIDGRTLISKDDIELKMSQGKTAEVDSQGHMINNTH